MLGQAGESPCPPNSTYSNSILLGGIKYCCYFDEDGIAFMLQC
jgi:hypothetical protein